VGIILQTGGTGRLEIHRLDIDKDFPTSHYSLWSNDKQQRLELTKKEAKELVLVLLKDLLNDDV